MSKKRYLNLYINIIVECSEYYADKVKEHPMYEAAMKAWKNNGRTVLGARCYEIDENVATHIRKRDTRNMHMADDANEIVPVPKWIFDVMKEAVRVQSEDIETGMKDGYYDNPQNTADLKYLEAAINYDPAHFTPAHYDEAGIMAGKITTVEDLQEKYGLEWVDYVEFLQTK